MPADQIAATIAMCDSCGEVTLVDAVPHPSQPSYDDRRYCINDAACLERHRIARLYPGQDTSPPSPVTDGPPW